MFEKEFEIARQFSGVAKLYGRQELARFQHSHVIVIGIGGPWVEALVRRGRQAKPNRYGSHF